jgi:hypothetical protein
MSTVVKQAVTLIDPVVSEMAVVTLTAVLASRAEVVQ